METAQPSSDPVNQVNETDLLQKMEDEHFRLQRQVRTIQLDREHRSMGVHPQFKKQDMLLKTLKQEYNSLKKDLKIAGSGSHKKRDLGMKRALKRALLLRVRTDQECVDGVTLMDQLEGLLRRNKEHMLKLRKSVTTTMGEIEARRMQSENRLISTENKLETAMLRFNAVQYENTKIREEIEHMLKDRALFNQSWTKMINTLVKGKKFLTDLFESSSLAYNQRDEWVGKLHSMQEKGKMDQMLQLQEMRDLQKMFDHEMKLHQFLANKGVLRVNPKQEEREEEMKAAKEEEIIREYQKHVDIIREIQDYTEEEEIHDIINGFKRKEQENFSRYQLLTEICAENIMLEKELKELRQMLLDRRDWNEMKEAEREDRIVSLTLKLEEQTAKTDDVRAKVEERNKLLSDTMKQIGDIFKIVGCSLAPFQNLLGDKGPTLWTHDLTLRLITEKINEYLQIVYYGEHKKLGKSVGTKSRLKKYTVHADTAQPLVALPINLMVPADPCPACVESRWMSRVSDTEETPFDAARTLVAIGELNADPSFVKSDRIHPLTECRVPRSRRLMATRFIDQ